MNGVKLNGPLFNCGAAALIFVTASPPTAIELGKLASETDAVFSLSSDEGGGEGRGEEFGFIGFPLSPHPLPARSSRGEGVHV